MATTIGRVQFIVDLDGDKIPAQARKIGRDIAKAGKSAGDDFGDEFESSFSKRLSTIGDDWSSAMRKQGRLSSETFMQSFEKGMRSRSGRIQSALADAVGDKDSFAGMLEGFDDVDKGVNQLIFDLEQLTKEKIKTRDADGKLHTSSVLTKERFDQIVPSLRAMGEELKVTRSEQAKLAEESERLDANIARLTRTVGDNDAFAAMSEKVGGTSTAYHRLRGEIDGLADANQLTIIQHEKLIDTLDRTREAVDKKADADAKATRDAEKLRLKTAELDKVLSDVDRKMGNIEVYRERVKALGSVRAANDDLVLSFDKLRDLGQSEQSIVRLENKLKSLNATIDKDKDAPNLFARIWQKASNKVGQSWQRMDGTVKLVIGSILSAGPTVATLGSALGAGLVAVGGAATSMLIGVAGAISVFSNLMQEIEDAPDAMKPAIRSFGRFKEALGEVNDAIAQAAFDKMGNAFDVLGDNIKALEPALKGVGTALGGLIKDFAEGTKPGTAAFKEINEAIKLAGPNITELGGIVGKFGTALLRAFNGAQPLVEDMFDWLGKLTGRFDAWTKSDSFSQWIRDAQRVWDAFGGTLDAVGRALNDLVTPEAVDNTVKFLDNLTRLAPAVGNLLSIFGALDIFGLLAKILADVGEALAPLTPMLVGFATALNNVVEAVPAGVWIALAAGIALVAAKIVQLKVAALVAPALESLAPTFTRMFGTLKPLPDALGNTSKGLSTLGKAGVIGAVVVGFVALLDVVKDWSRELAGIDDIVKKAVKGNESLIVTIDDLAGAADGISEPFTDAKTALDELSLWQGGNVFTNIAAVFKQTGTGAHDLNAALKELDDGMDDLPLEDQQKKFKGWAEELDATDAEVLKMLDSMPKYKDAVEDAALAEDGHASSADMVRIALGEMGPAAEGSADALAEMSDALDDGATGAELQAAALELLTGKSLAALDAVEGVAEGITTMGSAFRGQQDAAIGYQESLQGVTDSLGENGKAWDITSEAGRANRQAVMDLAESTLDLASQNYNLTGSAEEAAASIQTGRDAVIKAVEGMDLGGLSAEEYADKLGLIPGDVDTLISANTSAGMEMADAFAQRLYDLGLIEVNPKLALDAENAKAEAEAIQGELDGLTLTSYVTTLDANGDPISGVVEATSRQLEGFTTTPYNATLMADATQPQTAIDTLNASMGAYASQSYTTTLDASAVPATSVLDATQGKLNQFGKLTYTPKLDVDPAQANTKTDATKSKMTALGNDTFTPKLDAHNTKAIEKTKATADALEKLDGKTYTPKINADAADALNDSQAVKNSLDNIKSKTVTITVNTNYPNGKPPKTATGGVFGFPQIRQIAEAGPEAVVPLNRPLAQVDPSVRALSAFAQGLRATPSVTESGGGQSTGGGPSRVVNIQPGAIVVQGSLAPEATATLTVNRIAERIAG